MISIQIKTLTYSGTEILIVKTTERTVRYAIEPEDLAADEDKALGEALIEVGKELTRRSI